jgi:signal transduction histidine kinase
MIVHDLKNPLNSILNYSEKEPLKSLQKIKQSGKQMLNMVLNILDVQKYEESQMDVIIRDYSLLEISQNAISEVSFLAEQKNIAIHNTIVPEISVKTDKEILERIFVNIFTNAIKHTQNNGTVTVTIEHFLDKGDKLKSQVQKPKQIKILINDNGQGIPQDQLHKVFAKFGQIDAKKSGGIKSTGLGLAFCKLAVEALGGEIGVNSEEGLGTTFWFTLNSGEITMSETIVSTSKTIKPQNKALVLTEFDKLILKPFIFELQNVEVYETTEVDELLGKINPENSRTLKNWKQEMEHAVYLLNSEKYNELINLIVE